MIMELSSQQVRVVKKMPRSLSLILPTREVAGKQPPGQIEQLRA